MGDRQCRRLFLTPGSEEPDGTGLQLRIIAPRLTTQASRGDVYGSAASSAQSRHRVHPPRRTQIRRSQSFESSPRCQLRGYPYGSGGSLGIARSRSLAPGDPRRGACLSSTRPMSTGVFSIPTDIFTWGLLEIDNLFCYINPLLAHHEPVAR